MECLKCQFENLDTQKFCGECGEQLDKTCLSCGAKNPHPYKFCGECGHNLSLHSESALKEAFLDEVDRLRRYCPLADGDLAFQTRVVAQIDGALVARAQYPAHLKSVDLLQAHRSIIPSSSRAYRHQRQNLMAGDATVRDDIQAPVYSGRRRAGSPARLAGSISSHCQDNLVA